MGDRFDRDLMARRRRFGGMKIPEPILRWGLGDPAPLGHNNGPPLDDEQPGYLVRRYCWAKAHRAAWKNPPLPILKFRVARAEAAGVSYRDYMSELLDTGRYLQRSDAMTGSPAAPDARTTMAAALGSALTALGIERPTEAAALATRLAAAYTAPSRHYHAADHIADLLGLLAAHGGAVGERPALNLAILFHDVVYDATRSDNEDQSARFAEAELRNLGISPKVVDRVADLVRATKHGSAAAGLPDPVRDLLVDLDLAILAAEPKRYDAYAAAIRREYAHVPEDAYRQGRAAVLGHFLGQPQIYTTPWLTLLWEQPARRNLRAERARLLA